MLVAEKGDLFKDQFNLLYNDWRLPFKYRHGGLFYLFSTHGKCWKCYITALMTSAYRGFGSIPECRVGMKDHQVVRNKVYYDRLMTSVRSLSKMSHFRRAINHRQDDHNVFHELWSWSHPIHHLSDAAGRWTSSSMRNDIFRAQWQIGSDKCKFCGTLAVFKVRRNETKFSAVLKVTRNSFKVGF